MHLLLPTLVVLLSLSSALPSGSNEENESIFAKHSTTSQDRNETKDLRKETDSARFSVTRGGIWRNLKPGENTSARLEIVPSPDNSEKHSGIVEHVRKILESENSPSQITTERSISPPENSTENSKLEEGKYEERVSESATENAEKKSRIKMRESDGTRHDGSVEFFTKLSYNGGVENNLSRREDIAPNNEVKILGRHGSIFEEIFSNVEDSENSQNFSLEKSNDEERKKESSRSSPLNVSRDEGDKFEPREDDFLEAANFGLRAMHELYYVKEPKLYSMGLYLETDNPARYVAAFNEQRKEARNLAKFGYAVLEGTSMFMKKHPDFAREAPAFRNSQRTPLQRQCPRRGSPRCPPASLRYRTSDGSCNNLQNLWWGSAMSTMQRFLPAVYQDGIQTIRRSKNGRPLPSAREITNLIHRDQDVPLASVTHMLMQWGQFVDHDITATGQSRGFNGTIPQCCLPAGAGFQPPEFMHPECLPIPVSLRDDFFGPMGVRCLEFLRSGSAPREDCEFGPREQLTQVTSYLDASTVYSSDAAQSDSLRIFRNGLLQYGRIQSRRPLLPREDSDLCKRGSLSTSCFRAGDGRLSEQPALTSLHVVFLRLHNRIATKLAALNPHWSDEKLFQETRRIVGALVQHITYREFLPIVLGHEVMKIFDLEILKKGYYERYDSNVNPTVANAFSTAAYRFGHSLVQRSFVRFDRGHRPIFNNVSIHDEFSNPINLETPGSVDRLLLGLVNQPSQKRDEFISDELTNHLFQTPRFPFGMDLASLNIQRGRDHGLPPYVKWREPCGLSPIKTFQDFEGVTSPSAAIQFRSIYSSVEDIDLYPAGLAEKSVVGGLVGPTFACIIAQQFGNLRRGDRFWYENFGNENSFTPGQLQQIRRVTLAQILCQTMDNIETIQPFVFLLPDTLKNRRVSCHDELIGIMNLGLWSEGPAEFRGDPNSIRKEKRRTNNRLKAPTSTSSPNGGETPQGGDELIGTVDNREKEKSDEENNKFALPQRQKPFKANIRQQNRIVVKRPFGSPDNFTIVVQNNAVNSPVFVNDAIYGSNIRVHSSPTASKHERPNYDIREGLQNMRPGLQNPGVYNPIRRPVVPTSKPYRPHRNNNRPYSPHSFGDPSNPNPLSYGFVSDDPTNYAPDDVIFDHFGISGTRSPLYTYYINAEQKPTTTTPTPSLNHQLNLNNYSGNRKQGQSGHFASSMIAGYPGSSHFQDSSGSPQSSGSSGSSGSPEYSVPAEYFESPDSAGYFGSSGSKPSINPWSGWSIPRPTRKPTHNTFHSPSNEYNEYNDYTNWNNPQTQEQNLHAWNYEQKPTLTKPEEPNKNFFYSNNNPNDNRGPDSSYPNVPSIWNHHKRPSSNQNHYGAISNDTPGPSLPPQKTANYPSAINPTIKPIQVQSYSDDRSYSEDCYSEELPINPQQDSPDHLSSGSIYQIPNDDDFKESSTTGYQEEYDRFGVFDGFPIPKPVESHTETIEIVRGSPSSHYGSQKVKNEVPTPLNSQKTPRQVSQQVARKPGQYYYEENVLRRYPDGFDNRRHNGCAYSENPDNDKGKTVIPENDSISESSYVDSNSNAHVVRNDNSKIVTTPTIVLANENENENENKNNKNDKIENEDADIDEDYDLEGAFSENEEIISSITTNRMRNDWINPSEDPDLSSLLEMPEITANDSPSASELPKPMKLRTSGS